MKELNEVDEACYALIRMDESVDDLKSELITIAVCPYPLGTDTRNAASGTNVASITDTVMGLTSAVVQRAEFVHDGFTAITREVEGLDRV